MIQKAKSHFASEQKQSTVKSKFYAYLMRWRQRDYPPQMPKISQKQEDLLPEHQYQRKRTLDQDPKSKDAQKEGKSRIQTKKLVCSSKRGSKNNSMNGFIIFKGNCIKAPK